MQDLRSELRAYESSLPRERRKRLGQFFTESSVARLLAALCVQSPTTRILDPMAGHGSLLDAAAERHEIIGGRAQFFGIEIDPDTARLCQRRVDACMRQYRQGSAHIACGSAFDKTAWAALDVTNGFDLVIGNPPYVRYQMHKGKRDEVRDGLREIAHRYAPDAERHLWAELINGYSGLSDLSVPSWILCSIFCKADGLLALVVPRTWMNRDYARLIRYVQLRFFRPLYVVEEHGVGWFEDALVPTTLIVSRRLSPAEVLIPLNRRPDEDHAFHRIGISETAGRDGTSLVSNAFPCPDPEGAFASWAETDNSASPLLAARREGLAGERRRVLSAIRTDAWAKELEGNDQVLSVAETEASSLIPSAVAHAVTLPTRPNLISLSALGVQIGQGLRTGCNAFFYVDEVQTSKNDASVTVRASDVFHHLVFTVPRTILRPILRRQSEVSGFLVSPDSLSGRVLDLRNWLLAEDEAALQGQLFATPTTHEMPEPLAAYIRRAATTRIGRESGGKLIPQLSAVAPNERINGERLPRRWYMLPDFAPRHLPVIFVPRINDATPVFVSNARKAVLVDANFSTIHDRGGAPTDTSLLALLNSTWVRACCEASGSPMGAGALKLEATHLRSIPVPVPSSSTWEQLDRLGAQLVENHTADPARTIAAVDRLIAAEILGDANPEGVTTTCSAINNFVIAFRKQRLRKRGTHA